MTDQDFLRIATEVGNRKAKPYNFGAVVVKEGEIIAESESRVHETNDPSAHSEVLALRKAAEVLGTYQLGGTTMYSSHEPCVMCFSCALWANVDRIVYAIPAAEQEDFMYEFRDIHLDELAKHVLRKGIVVDHITLSEVAQDVQAK